MFIESNTMAVYSLYRKQKIPKKLQRKHPSLTTSLTETNGTFIKNIIQTSNYFEHVLRIRLVLLLMFAWTTSNNGGVRGEELLD